MKYLTNKTIFITIIFFTIMGSKLYVSDQTKTPLTTIQKKQKQLDQLYSDKRLG